MSVLSLGSETLKNEQHEDGEEEEILAIDGTYIDEDKSFQLMEGITLNEKFTEDPKKYFQEKLMTAIFRKVWSKISKINPLENRMLSINKNKKQATFEINPENIQDYIDCGMMIDELYVNYISRIFDASLGIKTIINARPLNEDSSEIQIISNYQFTSIETGTRWDFKTNEPKLILVGTPAYGAEPYRTCLSKNILESSLKNEIRLLE